MDARVPTWLTTDLNLLVTDVAQLRLHLAWLREDLALLPPSRPDRQALAERVARELDVSGAVLLDLARTIGKERGTSAS